MIEAEVKWAGDRQFLGTGKSSGHAIVFDLAEKSGGQNTGMRPTEAFLLGIASCTAVDMVNILTKMKVKLSLCKVEIAGEQMEDYPKYFHTITLKYTVSGEGLDEKRANKALSLSMDKYCAVSQSVKGRVNIKTELKIV